MKLLLTCMLMLSVLQQSLIPALGCGLCESCSCSVAQKSADESTVAAVEVLQVAGSCCSQVQNHSAVAATSCCSPLNDSGLPVKNCCCNSAQAADEVVITTTVTAQQLLENLLHFPQKSWEETLSLPQQRLTACAGWSVDDQSRPHRAARCHVLDCVWLI